jgi:hypothetical protein
VSAPVTITIAAAALGYSESQLRRRIKHGAPVVVRGESGRGNSTLIDVQAFRAWERAADSERSDIARREALRDACVAACSAFEETLAEILRSNELEQAIGIRPWMQARLAGYLWLRITQALRAQAERNDCASLPPLRNPENLTRDRQVSSDLDNPRRTASTPTRRRTR